MDAVQFDMPMKEYLGDPCPKPSLSSSLARLILDRSPAAAKAAWDARNDDGESRDIFNIGTAAHTMVLSEGDDIAVIDASDWRTKAAKEEREAVRAEGKTPLLTHQFEMVQAMAIRLHALLADHECAEAFNPERGKAEVSLFWQDGGAWKRARPDWIAYEGDTPSAVYHYKTVSESAAPHGLARLTASHGWDFIAAHYAEGCRAAFGADLPQRFVVQEKDDPHNLVVFELDPVAMGTAAMRLERATYLWARCVANGVWPGYPKQLMQIGTPEYHQARMVEMKDAENAYAQEYGRDILEAATKWQGSKL